jgi:hypothetical protein
MISGWIVIIIIPFVASGPEDQCIVCDVCDPLICNQLYSPLLGTDQHNVTNRDVTINNNNTLTDVFTGRCLVAASRFLFFRATSKVQCKVPAPD